MRGRWAVVVAIVAAWGCTSPVVNTPDAGGAPDAGTLLDASSDAADAVFDAPTTDAPPTDAGDPGDTGAPPTDAPTTDAPPTDAPRCGAGLTECGSECVDLASDTAHCRDCLTSCPDPANGAPTCTASGCGVSCDATFHECGGACVSDSSPSTCGTRCVPCAVPANASAATCDGTSCGFTCNDGFGDCVGGAADGCETDTTTSLAHCGRCGNACPAVTNGTPTCSPAGCGFTCNTGYRPSGATCEPIPAPRPVLPLSLGDVSLRRPTLRWALPSGVDGAVVELCRDRACGTVIETLRVTGSSARPSADLPANTAVFWRMRGRVGTTEGPVYSPTWLFHVPGRNATSGIDVSFDPHVDLDGDGFDDLVVGASQASPGGRTNAGAVYVHRGGSSGVPALATWTLEGAVALDQFGSTLSGAGDVDGDGYGDLVVGAYTASPGGRTRAGTVSLFRGGPTGPSATPSQVLEGVSATDGFGVGLSTAGDVNADGYGDVVVGALDVRVSGMTRAGTAYVFHGGATGLATAAARTLPGTAMDERFGQVVGGGGDWNGDGYSDIVVASMTASPGGRFEAGVARAFHGGPTGVGASAARSIEGAVAGNRLGVAAASAGDPNGDGFTDLVLGEYGAGSGSGAAHVYHGSATGLPASASRTLTSGVAGEFFGYSASGAGDVNGDGFADLVVGALNSSPGGRTSAGTARIYHGSSTGVAPAPARTLEGVTAGDEFGSAVSGIGDVNADGFADVAVGTLLASPGGRTRAGSVSVFLGSAAGLPTSPARVTDGAVAGDQLGSEIAWLEPLRAVLPRRRG